MDMIVQAILNRSKLEVSLIRITNATPTYAAPYDQSPSKQSNRSRSFVMAIESRVTDSGPLGATMSPMTVDLVGPQGVFGRLDLPEVKTSSKGANVNIPDQRIEIVDMNAYKAFVKSIQLDQKLTMRLENGKGTVKALGLTANIVYKKDVHMLGMNGPVTHIVKTEATDGGFQNTMKIINPSPLEIDLGSPTFAFTNAAGEVLATQSGHLHIVRGETVFSSTGEVKSKGAPDKVTLAGVTADKESWIQETIKFFSSPISLTPEMQSLVAA